MLATSAEYVHESKQLKN